MAVPVPIYTRLRGFNRMVAALEQAERMLSDFTVPLIRTRDLIWAAVGRVFDAEGGQAQKWPEWSEWTRDWRAFPPPEIPDHYYNRVPGPVADKIGQWSGEMKRVLQSGNAPAYSRVTTHRLQVGVSRTAPVKYLAFIQGRRPMAGISFFYNRMRMLSGHGPLAPGRTYVQPERLVYENVPVQQLGRSAFAAWARQNIDIFAQARGPL